MPSLASIRTRRRGGTENQFHDQACCGAPGRVENEFVGPDEWEKSDHKLAFRVGGRESVSGGLPGGPSHVFNCLYGDIVPNQRIVYTYDMHLDKKRISVSLATLELEPRERAEAHG